MSSRDLDGLLDERLLKEALETTARHEEIYLSRYRRKLANDSITVRYPPELAPAVEAFKLIAIKRYGNISRAFIRALGWLIKFDVYGLDIDELMKQEVADELERLAQKVEAAKKRSELIYCAHRLKFLAEQIRGLVGKGNGSFERNEKKAEKRVEAGAERHERIQPRVPSTMMQRMKSENKKADRNGRLPSFIDDNPWIDILSRRG